MDPGTYLAGGPINPQLDPYSGAPGTRRAEFVDGVFNNIIFNVRDPNDTGAGWQIINDGVTSSVITFGRGELFWGFSVIFNNRYTLESSSLTPTAGTLPALAGLGLIAARRRR